MLKNWNPHTLLVEMWNCAAPAEIGLAVLLKVKHRLTIRCSNSTPRYKPKGNENMIT